MLCAVTSRCLAFHNCLVPHFPPLQAGADNSSPAFSTPCNMVPIFPVLHFPPLQFGADNSSPAFSSLAFSAPPFWAAIHILRLNCAETIQDRPGQLAYEIFGIKRRFQRCKGDPLGTRSPPYERINFGYPFENVRFLLLSTNLAREWLQIDTGLMRIITSTADELFGGTNIDDLERP